MTERPALNNRPPITEKKWGGVERPFYKQCRNCRHKMRGLGGRRDNPWYWECGKAPDVPNGIGVILPDGSIRLVGYDPKKSSFCSKRNADGDCPMMEPKPPPWWKCW